MSTSEMDELEEQLLAAGRVERETEELLGELRKRCRAAGLAGKHDEADQIWSTIEAAKVQLLDIQRTISKIENRLYGMRRKRV